MAVTTKVPEVCRHGTPLNMTCGPCDRILPGNPEALIPDLIAPARGWQLSHRDDDLPCGCDDCMELQAEDAGVAWWRLPKVDRERLRRNSSGDDRLADPIAPARGIAWGCALLWVAIFAVAAVIVVWP